MLRKPTYNVNVFIWWQKTMLGQFFCLLKMSPGIHPRTLKLRCQQMQSLLLKYETTSRLSSSDNVNVLRRQGKQIVTLLVKKWFTVPINTTDGHISKRRSTVKQSQHKSCKTCKNSYGNELKKKLFYLLQAMGWLRSAWHMRIQKTNIDTNQSGNSCLIQKWS